MATNGKKRMRTESQVNHSSPTSKRVKYNKEHYIPIEEREQLTRKQIAERLHFESYNDEHTKVFTKKDQLSILNKKSSFSEIDRKIEDMNKQNKYEKTTKGMFTMLNDLCDLENEDKHKNEQFRREKRHKLKEKKRLLELQEQYKKYEGCVKNIELTKHVKHLTLDTRERAISKLLQYIKQNRNSDTKTEHNMSVECELNICKTSNTAIAYGQYVREQLHRIRTMTKDHVKWEMNVDRDNNKDGSDSDSDSDSSSDDDDLPIGLRVSKKRHSAVI